MQEPKHTNSLINASSPYLLQHAHNPVNWLEWSGEAFEKARREDKLVLVSIGYSSCHWCHVMEHESFGQEDTAAIMNEHFICIKVDREERPDVDQLYMDAVQLLTGRGGWPLNCFTLPDGRPIHGGTYFPKQEWERVLRSLSAFYRDKKEEALEYAAELTRGIRKLNIIEAPSGSLMPQEEITALVAGRKKDLDRELGGFAWAPKFPMPVTWELFLKQYYYTGDHELLQAVVATLDRMANGGICDQVGGGFARYSVDVFWKVPHFEKMLYDNAQLVSLYCQAFSLTGSSLYEHTVKQTLGFIAREMTSENGLFFSALDADSEGVEGLFYTWHKKELQEILGEDEPLFSLYYSVDAYGNWEHERNILYRTRPDEELARLTGMPVSTLHEVIERCRRRLLHARESRTRPGLDDKSITSWNALMIKAYADAYLVFGNEEYLAAALRAADFISDNLWCDGRLFRIYRKGRAAIGAFAEDYALLCDSMIRLYEAAGEERYLVFARQLLDACINGFYDRDKKAFYFKSKEDEPLVSAKIDLNDDVIPSSNSVLARCLLVLGYLFDEPAYHEMADDLLKLVQEKIRKFPGSCSNWLQVLLTRQHGLKQVVVSGPGSADHASIFWTSYLPDKVVLMADKASDLPLLREKTGLNDLKFYLCVDKVCSLPVNSAGDVLNELEKQRLRN